MCYVCTYIVCKRISYFYSNSIFSHDRDSKCIKNLSRDICHLCNAKNKMDLA